MDDVDEMLVELHPDAAQNGEVEAAKGQLELFGTLLTSLADRKHDGPGAQHAIVRDGRRYEGSWEEIVQYLRDERGESAHSLEEFMRQAARRGFRETGIHIPSHDAESFIRGSAVAGLLRIVQ